MENKLEKIHMYKLIKVKENKNIFESGIYKLLKNILQYPLYIYDQKAYLSATIYVSVWYANLSISEIFLASSYGHKITISTTLIFTILTAAFGIILTILYALVYSKLMLMVQKLKRKGRSLFTFNILSFKEWFLLLGLSKMYPALIISALIALLPVNAFFMGGLVLFSWIVWLFYTMYKLKNIYLGIMLAIYDIVIFIFFVKCMGV